MSRTGRSQVGEVSQKSGTALRAAVATVAVVTLVLGMTLFAIGCGGGAGPEATVQQFLTAMENQDIDTIIDITVSPEELAMMEAAGMSADDLKTGMEEELFSAFGAMKFSDVTMEAKQEGDEATVTFTGGSLTLEAMGMTLDLVQATAMGFPGEFYLHKVDGKWYLDLEG